MIKSMTGYGKSSLSFGDFDVEVEIKSVNHRYLDINIKMPHGLWLTEIKLREILKERLSRGSISAQVVVKESSEEKNRNSFDLEKARSYLSSLQTVKKELGIEGDIRVDTLLQHFDIFADRTGGDSEDIDETIRKCFISALEDMISYREKEGMNLQVEFENRISDLQDLVDETEKSSSKASQVQFERLLERINKMCRPDDISKERLEQELVLISDRVDITEEISRLNSHISLFKDSIKQNKAVGKIINNLIQEMHREASTISAKTNLTEISHLSVRMKEIIEMIREQVQNVE